MMKKPKFLSKTFFWQGEKRNSQKIKREDRLVRPFTLSFYRKQFFVAGLKTRKLKIIQKMFKIRSSKQYRLIILYYCCYTFSEWK